MRVVPHAVGIPVVRVLMLVEGTVGVPEGEPVAALLRGVGIPGWASALDILPGVGRVVGLGTVGMQLTDVAAVVAGLVEHIAHADGLGADIADGAVRVAVEGHAALVGVHAREQ